MKMLIRCKSRDQLCLNAKVVKHDDDRSAVRVEAAFRKQALPRKQSLSCLERGAASSESWEIVLKEEEAVIVDDIQSKKESRTPTGSASAEEETLREVRTTEEGL